MDRRCWRLVDERDGRPSSVRLNRRWSATSSREASCSRPPDASRSSFATCCLSALFSRRSWSTEELSSLIRASPVPLRDVRRRTVGWRFLLSAIGQTLSDQSLFVVSEPTETANCPGLVVARPDGAETKKRLTQCVRTSPGPFVMPDKRLDGGRYRPYTGQQCRIGFVTRASTPASQPVIERPDRSLSGVQINSPSPGDPPG